MGSTVTGRGLPAQHHLWSGAQQHGDGRGSRRNIWKKQKEWSKRGDRGGNLSRRLFLLNRPRNDNNSLADYNSCLGLQIHNSRSILRIPKWDWKKYSTHILYYKNVYLSENWTRAIYPQVMAEWQNREYSGSEWHKKWVIIVLYCRLQRAHYLRLKHRK